MTDYEKISREAEADLNTYQSKTGNARAEGGDGVGANTMAENKFRDAGAEVTTGDELSTNAGYNKRIPPSEGGVLDDRGRQATGQQYEGSGGPIDKINQRDGGRNDQDLDGVYSAPSGIDGIGSRNDIATQGKAASLNNVGPNQAEGSV